MLPVHNKNINSFKKKESLVSQLKTDLVPVWVTGRGGRDGIRRSFHNSLHLLLSYHPFLSFLKVLPPQHPPTWIRALRTTPWIPSSYYYRRWILCIRLHRSHGTIDLSLSPSTFPSLSLVPSYFLPTSFIPLSNLSVRFTFIHRRETP